MLVSDSRNDAQTTIFCEQQPRNHNIWTWHDEAIYIAVKSL